ncbi:MAG: GerMN domain-containing protein [Actinobacteria bacterium]|nr:GerMN domain-containing protein [Actinomycetota bacterium]MBM3713746.1 GerMN domain-containing protein [Actinomycetota bacterium]
MRPEEELFKKKKKRSFRFVKFIFILILIIIIALLVFYSLENPSFVEDVKNKLLSFYTGQQETADSREAAESVETDAGDEIGIETEGKTGNENEVDAVVEDKQQEDINNETVDEAEDTSSSFWQKIINFFKEKISKQEEEFPARLKIRVYFASLGKEDKFIYEERDIVAGELKTAAESAVKELIKGPVKSYHYPVIPSGTKLLGVEIYENLAKINLSQEFLEKSLDSGILDEYVIYTIVNTVTEIPGVDGVIFFIEGSRIKYYGRVDLSIPAIRDEKYLPDSEE